MARDEPALLELWKVCKAMVKKIDPAFRFSSIQVNRNFSGVPHVDGSDVTYQYALSLGEFTGGRLVVATDDPLVFRSYDTKNRLTKCDGRHPHWVTPFKGQRYSLIFYRIHGRVSPRLSNAAASGTCKSVDIKRALPRMKTAAR
jgi:hypothetical protein